MSIGALVKKWATGGGYSFSIWGWTKARQIHATRGIPPVPRGHSGDIDLRYYECALFIVTSAAQSVKLAWTKVDR